MGLQELQNMIDELEHEMQEAARAMEFSKVAELRDQFFVLREILDGIEGDTDWIDELNKEIRECFDRLAAISGIQNRRIAKLENINRRQENHIADLNATVSRQQDRLDKLEKEIDDILERIDEREVDSLEHRQEKSEPPAVQAENFNIVSAGIFHPIEEEATANEPAGLPIPPREPESAFAMDETTDELSIEGQTAIQTEQTRITTTEHDQYQVMAVFIEAQGKYVDYIGDGLPKAEINRLAQEGKLERHKFHPYKLRTTPAGEDWYRKRVPSQEPPRPVGQSPSAELGIERTPTPRELRRKDLGSTDFDYSPEGGLVQAEPRTRSSIVVPDIEEDEEDSAQIWGADEEISEPPRPVDIPPELSDIADCVIITGGPESATARLLAIMMENGWQCGKDTLEAVFKKRFFNPVIEDINERALDRIDDMLVTYENGLWRVDEEYRGELERILNHPDYRLHIPDSPVEDKPLEELVQLDDSWKTFAGSLRDYHCEMLSTLLSDYVGGYNVRKKLRSISTREDKTIFVLLREINKLAQKHLGYDLVRYGSSKYSVPTIAREHRLILKPQLWRIDSDLDGDSDV